MKKRLIAAIVIASCALAAMILLLPPETVETSTVIEAIPVTIPETTEETVMTESTEPKDSLVMLLESMTLEEKVGQLFLARCPEGDAAGEAARCHLGGYLFFGRDFEGQTPDTFRDKVHSCQAAAGIPLLIAVDEEGGDVCRVSSYPAFRLTRFGSPRKLYQQGGMERVLNEESEKAWLLSSLGINVNMAPVCDLSDVSGAFMYRRSLGQSPEITGEFVSGAIKTMAQFGVGTVMKHFPGYGNNADTHTGIAVDSRSLQELESRDLQPFFAGIEAGGNAILVSHNIVTAMDSVNPASLSPEIHRYLRLAMGFDGVIVTDDLSMDAIAARYGTGEAAVLAVLAGNDLLCSTEYSIQYAAVLEAARNGRIPEDTLDASVLRLLRWKQALQLI